MKVTKAKEHVLLSNKDGEYHFSLEEFASLGEEKAIEKATKEIEKKLKADQYGNQTITFDQARALGFCEYGIKDFCERLNLDLKKTHTISEILNELTVDVFLEYSDECSKLFGKNDIMTKFGGVKKFLSENKTRKALNFVLGGGFIEDKNLHLLACDFAERVLPIFEQKYPEDKRPRRAIEIKRLWIEEEYK